MPISRSRPGIGTGRAASTTTERQRGLGFPGRVALVTLVAVLALVSSCRRFDKKAGGPEDEIVVLCEKGVWEEVESDLSSAMEKVIFTPTKELVFELRRIEFRDFNLFRFRRNILVLGTLGADGEVSNLIGQLLSQEAKNSVLRNETYLFGREDAWAEGQRLLVVAAPNEIPFTSVLERQKHGIYKFFDEGRTERIRVKIYGEGYQEKVAQRLAESYGWSINLPLGYRTAEEDSGGHFISFIRHYPDRVIFVHWEERESTEIDAAACLSRRNYIGSKYLDGDEIDRERTKTEMTEFQGRKALKIKGIWHNDEKVMGGPFQTYCFHDDHQRRFYLLDFHVFIPGKKKLSYLKELDLICQTFRTH